MSRLSGDRLAVPLPSIEIFQELPTGLNRDPPPCLRVQHTHRQRIGTDLTNKRIHPTEKREILALRWIAMLGQQTDSLLEKLLSMICGYEQKRVLQFSTLIECIEKEAEMRVRVRDVVFVKGERPVASSKRHKETRACK